MMPASRRGATNIFSLMTLTVLLTFPSLTALPQTGQTPTSARTQVGEVEPSVENDIRALEKAESEAVVARDTRTLEGIWADDFTVNTPYNKVGTGSKGGPIHLYYERLDRNIEKVTVYSDQLAMTMGNEVIKRKPPMSLAGQTLTRRFTHVWMKRNGKWQLAIRHANFICPDTPQQQIQKQ